MKGDTLYAIPAYVDDNTPTIKKHSMNLLEGPKSRNVEQSEFKRSNKKNYIIFGHYENPTTEKIFDTIGKSGDKAITVRDERNVWYENAGENDDKVIISGSDHRQEKAMKSSNVSKVIKQDEIAETKQNNNSLLKKLLTSFKTWFDNEENKILKLLMVVLIGTFITMVFYFQSTVRELRQSQNGSKTKIPRSGDSNSSYTIVESADGGECSPCLVIIVDVSFVINLIDWMINSCWLVDYFQMFLECSNNKQKVHFNPFKIKS